jgi:hypothetical protein
MSRPVASCLTRGRVCHFSFVVVLVKNCNIFTVQIYTQYIKQTMNNIYMASVSPGAVQQIMHFLSPIML